MTTISAQTILRSRNAAAPDKVLSTLLLRYPRFIHAELMTHRAFSRNSASSRAIPVQKMIDDVENDPATPLFWGGNQRGMQAGPEVNLALATIARQNWDRSRESAIGYAQSLKDTGLHKQIVNRILEPYSHITVLVSATEWDNFLELRDHKDAEPHIEMLAREIRKCLEREDDIQDLRPGDWHLPFVTPQEMEDITTEQAIKISTARCASTSYKTVDGFDMTIDRAIKLHDKLVGARPIHASPAEHVARADGISVAGWLHPSEHGNFSGFRQYRKQLEQALCINSKEVSTATDFLDKAKSLLAQRGKDYDIPEGERSMGKTIAAFNAITGRDLKETDGWLIMALLKMVRQETSDGFHADSAEDLIAYAALAAEAGSREHE